ncbi:triadin-like [Anopheles albimanus]|uniref:triadin-like n=1 Tax=Anopheles albimanus TaxID=7167 RepID=UPI001641141E|nr:triadin-like [Anopheles albimanus]
MDTAALKTYHREIGHLIFDANEKVSVRKISNLWNIDSQQSVEILQKWIDDQKDSAKLSREFLIRGKDKNGNVFMTLANEKRAAKITSKYVGCSKMLYSVEASSDVRPMNVSSDRDFAVIKLRLESERRELAKRSLPTAQPAVAAVKQEQKPSKANGLFGAMASKQVKTPAVAKEEKSSSPPPPAPAVPTIKPEPQTPTIKVSPKKASPKKDTRKQTNGKGSISSFFSSNPGQTALSKAVVKTEPESPSNAQGTKKASEEQKKLAKSRKRTIDEDEEDEVAIKKEREDEEEEEEEIPNTPQEEKREAKKRRTGKPLLQRKSVANQSKKSRIYAICDSSSEDEAEATEKRREEERLVKFDQDPEIEADPEPMEASTISPEKPVENDSNSVNRNHRGKIKKLVTKTFMTADGFMETVKEYEMVSEDEAQEAAHSEQSPAVDTKLGAPNAKQVKAESIERKKTTPPTPRTKQGSIMSFFAKK